MGSLEALFDLSGRVAVITGGNRGIGLGMARGLARAGAALALWSRNEERNALAADELRDLGVDAEGFACDVSDEASVVAACSATLERFGRIDVGVANAGFGRYAEPLEMSLDHWRKILSTNLDGAFLTFQKIAKHMVERGGGGKLIAISSMVELFGSPKQPNYAASKGAISAMVRSFAVDLARHDIQVNSIQPGWIGTEALGPVMDDAKMSKAILSRTPARRFGEAEDLEGIAVYLASDASRYHTGDTIRIDGGYSVF